MQEKEIKILWGRSGNRCSICKLELTPDGDRETLGEMAHIVAKSDKGPRGGSPVSQVERDKYANLILLCPTHHAEIDKNFGDWPVERLQQIKHDHEKWVSKQLAEGNINVIAIDNAPFLAGRFGVWKQLCREHVGIVLSFTPLRIAPKTINSLDDGILQLLKQATLPADGELQRVNPYHVRPTEFGAVVERFSALPNRSGHSIHVFDSGHCEYLYELGSRTDRITQHTREKGTDIKGARHIVRYTDIAETSNCAIQWLSLMWSKALPFEYMEFRCSVINTADTTLYSHSDGWDGGVFGYPIKSTELVYSDVLSRDCVPADVLFDVLKWYSRCYGLVLTSVLDRKDCYARPEPMI